MKLRVFLITVMTNNKFCFKPIKKPVMILTKAVMICSRTVQFSLGHCSLTATTGFCDIRELSNDDGDGNDNATKQ